MLADYDFYHNIYKGIVFTNATTYEYFGERASDELAFYSNRQVFADLTAQTQLKKCACKIAEILYSTTNDGKVGKSVTSESIAGYYSVSYQNKTDNEIKYQINSAIKTYIGKYFLGAKKVMW